MRMFIELSREEIGAKIPYAIVCETMQSSRWDTGKRKKLMKEEFTEKEIKAIYVMKEQARIWFLVKGVPDTLKILPKTLDLWQRLGNFCANI